MYVTAVVRDADGGCVREAADDADSDWDSVTDADEEADADAETDWLLAHAQQHAAMRTRRMGLELVLSLSHGLLFALKRQSIVRRVASPSSLTAVGAWRGLTQLSSQPRERVARRGGNQATPSREGARALCPKQRPHHTVPVPARGSRTRARQCAKARACRPPPLQMASPPPPWRQTRRAAASQRTQSAARGGRRARR